MITQIAVKMTPVDAKLLESVGYANAKRQLYVKFRGSPMMCFDDVPGFRFQGLLAAPRKDAYYETYIKGQFLAQPVQLPPAA